MAAEMSSLERVLATLRREEPDRVPTLEWSINARVKESLHPGCGKFDFEERCGLDGVVVYADYRKQWLSDTTYRDEWGITMAITEEDYPTGIDFPLKQPEQLETLNIPDPCAPWRFDGLREAVRRFKGKKAIFFRLRDAYSLPRYLRGMENLMMDYLLNPDLVESLVNTSLDFYTRMAYCAMEIGADVFWTSDDYCDNRGPVMGVELWRKFNLPGLKKLVSAVLQEGYPFVKHCDGNINPIAEDLVNAGVSCLDPIDVGAGVRLQEVKSRYGDRIALKGGVPLDVLAKGKQRDVESAVKQCLMDAARGGGYILSSSSDVTAAVVPQNYRSMVNACREYGKYPLDKDRLRS
jgi:uroporphyrinogen decarboxylase